LHVENHDTLDEVRRVLWETIGRVNDACNRFRDDSEISQINASHVREHKVSPTLASLLGAAVRSAALTNNLVTPTVLPALLALGYDRDFAALASSTSRATQSTASSLGGFTFDTQNATLVLDEGCQLDLGSSGKAHCIDMVLGQLGGLGGVVVEIGGDVGLLPRTDGEPWTVGVGGVQGEETGDVLGLFTGGLATSGTSLRQWRNGDALMHHVIDPRTGTSAESCWVQASVAAGSCVDANAFSTASIIWSDDAPYHLAQAGLAGRLVTGHGDVSYIGSWPRTGVAA
jgi:thiamine biosynthesis lipoprotein